MNSQNYLNQQELRTFWDLSTKLVEAREISLFYLLERSSLEPTKAGKMAWLAVYKLQRFVETYHRFPKQEEMAVLLDSSEILEEPLTQFDFWSNRDALLALDLIRKTRQD